MIHYALRCKDGHEFDGWFKSSTSFEAQADGGLLACPTCASCQVSRALMAPRISPRGYVGPVTSVPGPALPAPVSGGSGGAVPEPMPDRMRAVLSRIRTEVEARCTYVGPQFATVVRGMAESGKPKRSVYGEATAEEAAALADDGIEVTCIPWVPRADS